MKKILYFFRVVNELLTSKTINVIGLLFIFSITFNVFAAPSDLDPTFGDGGKVLLSPDGSEQTYGSRTALQPDGKIVIVGNGANLGFIVTRYNSNGSLDTTFGNNGWTSVLFPGDYNNAVSVAIQADGKIVTGGTIRSIVNNVPNYDFAIVRFNLDGSLDTTFDGDGKLTISFNDIIGFFYTERLGALKIADNGKIVVAGYALDAGVDDRFVLARINPDGSLDTTFGINGKVGDISNGPSNHDRLTDMVVLPDGKIVIVGYIFNTLGSFRIAIKYSASGSREWVYSKGASTFPNITEYFTGIAVQSDGKFIAVGSRASKIVAVRINADGTEDTTFTNPTTMPNGGAGSVAIQPDGKIVATVGGYSLVRYNTNGSLDLNFGNNGFASVTVTGLDSATNVVIQPDGKYLLGGYSVIESPTRYYFSMVRYRGGNVIPQRASFDYDGDGKSDVSVFRPSQGVWYLNQSTNGFSATQFGISTDRIVPADYDGDGKTDISIYRDGIWWILQSGNNLVKAIQFGVAEDKPQSGDFDGDGKDDLAVFRPSNGGWYILRSSDNGFYGVQFGISEDIPQSSDYDGDGKTDIAIFRPSSGVWYVQKSSGGYSITQFGLSGDKPVANDYDGDGNSDISVWRPSSGVWYIFRSSSNQVYASNFGLAGDIPVPADYNGDGKTNIALFRQSNGTWYQILSEQGTSSQVFGLTTDRPTPSAYNP